jgi:hypothetical protein
MVRRMLKFEELKSKELIDKAKAQGFTLRLVKTKTGKVRQYYELHSPYWTLNVYNFDKLQKLLDSNVLPSLIVLGEAAEEGNL